MAEAREIQELEIEQRQLSDREERLARMSAKNISQKDMAASENVSESLISQMLNSEHVKKRVASLKAKSLGEDLVYDEKLSRVQLLTLNKLQGLVTTLDDPLKAANVLKIVDGLKRKVDPTDLNRGVGNSTIINITIPVAAVNAGLVQNDKRQVIEIDGTALINAGSTNFMEKVNEQKRNELARLERANAATGQVLGPNDL